MWNVTKVCSVLAGIILASTFIGSQSAVQQAAGAAIAVGIAVIPYCLARAISEDKKEKTGRIDKSPKKAFEEFDL